MIKLWKPLVIVAMCITALNCAAQEETLAPKDSGQTLNIDSVLNESLLAVEEVANDVAENEKAIKELTIKSSIRNLGSSTSAHIVNISESDTVHLYDSSFIGLELLDTVVGKYSIFITGENHTYTESNARLWLKMIKYLHANAAVRNIMFEYGFSYGYLVNEYLQTGDTALFASIDKFAYDEYSSVIKELKEFNDSLPTDEKLYFTAIDIERGLYPIVKLLDRLLPPQSEDIDDSLYVDVQSIRSLSSYNDFQLDEEDSEYKKGNGFTFKTGASLRLLHQNFLRNEAKFKEYLGSNFDLFKRVIVDNYNARFRWEDYENDNTVQEYIYREDYMHRRFLEEKAQHPGNWFGQFGRCHTTQEQQSNNSCDWFVFNSLADRIKHTKGGEYEDQVLTLTMVYDDDRDFGPDKAYAEELLDTYFYNMPESSLYIIDIRSDSALNSAYGNDFNYLILNTKTERGNAYSYLNDYENDNSEERLTLAFGYRMQNFDFSNLNSRFNGNYSSFSELKTAFEISVLNHGEKLNTGTFFGVYRPEKLNVGDSAYQLNGFYINALFSAELFKKVKWFDLMPGLGLGYSKLKMGITEPDTTAFLPRAGSLGESKYSEFINDAFTMDASIITDFNFGWLTLGYQAGFIADLSNKLWKSNKTHLDFSPKTSFSGFYQTVRLGVNF